MLSPIAEEVDAPEAEIDGSNNRMVTTEVESVVEGGETDRRKMRIFLYNVYIGMSGHLFCLLQSL